MEVLPGKLDGRRKKMAELRVVFWSADWSPWQAVVRLRRNWPALAFALTPDYAQGTTEGPGASAPEGSGSSSVGRRRTGRG